MSQHTGPISDDPGDAGIDVIGSKNLVLHLSPKECFRLLTNSRPGKERYDEIDRILNSRNYSFSTKYVVSKIRELFPYWCDNGKEPMAVREYISVCKANGITFRKCVVQERI